MKRDNAYSKVFVISSLNINSRLLQECSIFRLSNGAINAPAPVHKRQVPSPSPGWANKHPRSRYPVWLISLTVTLATTNVSRASLSRLHEGRSPSPVYLQLSECETQAAEWMSERAAMPAVSAASRPGSAQSVVSAENNKVIAQNCKLRHRQWLAGKNSSVFGRRFAPWLEASRFWYQPGSSCCPVCSKTETWKTGEGKEAKVAKAAK